jgi:hypothetical protein
MNNLNGRSTNGSNRPDHTEIEGLLTAYIAGELDEETELALVERHIAGCTLCQQTVVETSRVFTLLSTLTLPDTSIKQNEQQISLADAVLAQIAQGKPADANETIEAFSRPLLPFPGVLNVEQDNEVFLDTTGIHSLSPRLRKSESPIQIIQPIQPIWRESGRNMKNLLGALNLAPTRGRAKSGPYRWLVAMVASVLVLLVVGSSLTILVRMAQHNTRGASPSGKTGGSLVGSVTSTAKPQNVRQQAHNLVKQFHEEAATWGAAHLYHDSFDGHTYQLNVAYMQAGLGGMLDAQLAQAQTDADFQNVVNVTNNALFNLHMLEADANDSTPFNQPHQSDLQLIKHYQLKGQVVVVSLAGQAMRIYQDGKLVKAFLITSGQPKLPALPIVTKEVYRLTSVVFESSLPKGNPGWYPAILIHYAIQYHDEGYFVYDAWWQTQFGPGTQFPHQDTSTNKPGGGITLSTNDAAWVYNHTNLHTTIAIY